MLSAHMKTKQQQKKTIIYGLSLTTQGQENSPAQPGEGADDGSMTSTQGRLGSSSPCYFSFDYKTIAKFTRGSFSHPPACKPHNSPILINHFSSLTLISLSPPCWDIKHYGTRTLWRPCKWHQLVLFSQVLSHHTFFSQISIFSPQSMEKAIR